MEKLQPRRSLGIHRTTNIWTFFFSSDRSSVQHPQLYGILPLLLKNNLFFSNFVIRWLLHHFHISISCEETWISIKYGSDLITPKIFHVVTVKMKMWWKKGITIYWKVWNVCTYLFVVFSKKKVSKSFSLKLLLLAYCHATHKVATNGWDSTIKYLCKSVVARKLIFFLFSFEVLFSVAPLENIGKIVRLFWNLEHWVPSHGLCQLPSKMP